MLFLVLVYVKKLNHFINDSNNRENENKVNVIR